MIQEDLINTSLKVPGTDLVSTGHFIIGTGNVVTVKHLLCAKLPRLSPERKERGEIPFEFKQRWELRPRGGDPRAWGLSFPTRGTPTAWLCFRRYAQNGGRRLCLSALGSSRGHAGGLCPCGERVLTGVAAG